MVKVKNNRWDGWPGFFVEQKVNSVWIYTHIYICVCVCVCVCEREREDDYYICPSVGPLVNILFSFLRSR
jgi:hypothetical protein